MNYFFFFGVSDKYDPHIFINKVYIAGTIQESRMDWDYNQFKLFK